MERAANSTSEPGSLPNDDVETRTTTLRGRSVLVIDDDEANSRALALILRQSGFTADFVFTGAQALAAAQTAAPDAVVLDLHLADDDVPGFVVLKSLRAKFPNLPIIAITGWYLADGQETEARALGAIAYLFKPVDDSDLLANLHAALAGPPSGQITPSNARPVGAAYTASSRWGDREATLAENDWRELAAAESAFIGSQLRRLGRSTRLAFPTVWEDVIVEQIEDTLIEFLAKVKRGTWPVFGSLDTHLRRAAWRNVRDQLQAATRRAAYEALYAREQAQLSRGDDAHSPAAVEALLTLAHTEAERDALRRWAEDESSSQIAEALGLSHLPSNQQSREVKRFKDRIKKRARRIKW